MIKSSQVSDYSFRIVRIMDKKVEIKKLLDEGYAPAKIVQMYQAQGYDEEEILHWIDLLESKQPKKIRFQGNSYFFLVATLLILTAVSAGVYYYNENAEFSAPYTTFLSDDEIVDVENLNPRMLAAIQKARAELGMFKEKYRTDTEAYYLVKGIFSGTREEHIWCRVLSIEGTKWSVEVRNDPAYVSGLWYGDIVTIDEKDISDWIIMKEGKRSGGYTFEVLTADMTQEEKKYYEQAWVELAEDDLAERKDLLE